jgi:hypothetical protein
VGCGDCGFSIDLPSNDPNKILEKVKKEENKKVTNRRWRL